MNTQHNRSPANHVCAGPHSDSPACGMSMRFEPTFLEAAGEAEVRKRAYCEFFLLPFCLLVYMLITSKTTMRRNTMAWDKRRRINHQRYETNNQIPKKARKLDAVFGQVDCIFKENEPLCLAVGATLFPTLIVSPQEEGFFFIFLKRYLERAFDMRI